VPLTPKVFSTLLVLVESGGRVVDKETIIGAVWPDAFVEESNLTQNVFVLRKTLGADERGRSTSGLSRGAATSSRRRSRPRATCCRGRGG
jgi:DNA-binding winged helix-turn-helix (wHTH) protein